MSPPVTHRLPRRKPRKAVAALAYRTYRAARRVIPPRTLERFTLTAAWLGHRVALEQVTYRRGGVAALRLIRPHVAAAIEAEAQGTTWAIDIGGGSGAFTRLLAGACEGVVYADLDAANVEWARETCADVQNVEFEQADGFVAAEERGPFDLAMMLHVLEHLDDPVAKLRQLRGCCGRLLLEVPDLGADPLNLVRVAEGLPFHADDDHVSEFTTESLKAALAEAGWRDTLVGSHNGMLVATARAH